MVLEDDIVLTECSRWLFMAWLNCRWLLHFGQFISLPYAVKPHHVIFVGPGINIAVTDIFTHFVELKCNAQNIVNMKIIRNLLLLSTSFKPPSAHSKSRILKFEKV